jgi:hypothetical protein
MNNWTNLPTKTIQATDELFQYLKEETVDDINNSFKNISKKIKAGFYLSLATIFLIIGISIVGTQIANGNYFIEALIYFSMTLFCVFSFGFIIWKIWK